MTTSNRVGEIIRIEYDEGSGDLRIIIEVTDPRFKNKILHNKDFDDILTIEGRDAMVIASKKKGGE